MTTPIDDEELPDVRPATMSRRVFLAAVVLIAITVAMLLLWPFMFFRIGPGQRGVHWRIDDGTRLDEVYTEGLRAIAPWDALFIYDTRVHEIREDVTVLAANGLPVTVRFSGRYLPDVHRLPLLHQTFGPQYEQTVVRPEMIAAIRAVIGRYRPEDIYTRPESSLLAEIRVPLQRQLARNYVVLNDILLISLRLTPQVEGAINEKLMSEQQALAYQFRLRAESSEADRKRLEAAGIRDFQSIAGVSAIQWRSLDVTSDLAKSPNSKTIIFGTGTNQVPILLNAGQK